MDTDADKLVKDWEEIYKKGQLTFWILLSLSEGPKRTEEVRAFIDSATNGLFSVDEQSMYRALRRYYDTELVSFKFQNNPGGRDWKIYSLTLLGTTVLRQFARRNIANVFYKQDVRSIIERCAA